MAATCCACCACWCGAASELLTVGVPGCHLASCLRPPCLTSSPPHLLTSSPPHLLTSSPPALAPRPQAFNNINPSSDIFNNINQQFWEYVLPGCDAWGYIACTGAPPLLPYD